MPGRNSCAPGTRPRTTSPITSPSWTPETTPTWSGSDLGGERGDGCGRVGPHLDRAATNVGFAVVARVNAQIHAAISRIRTDPTRWSRAVHQDGTPRPGAMVAEITDLLDLSAMPDGTRAIVRREPLHPGAQASLFPSEHFRYWGHYTDAQGDPVTLDVHMRGHARVEDNIRRLKDSGARRFPFTDIDANRAWLAIVAMADALVRWFQLLCLTGPLAVAEPTTLRWALWHTPARLVRRARRTIVRILDDWPTAHHLLGAYQQIALLA